MNDDGKPLPNQPQLQNWRELAEKASKEPDQDRVLDLVRQLNERLEEAEKQKRQPTGPTPQSPKTQ
jgi:hypothetical protein